MNLSSLVHTGRQQFEHHSHQYQPRPQQAMSSSISAPQYPPQHPSQHTQYTYNSVPQPPPSPPVDETSKCSLPSISSLLGLADGPNQQETQVQQTAVSSRPGSGHQQQYGSSPRMSSRGALPPTPPMLPDTAYDGRQSPSVASVSGYSVASAPGYYFNPAGSTINNVEPHSQRQSAAQVSRRVSMPTVSNAYAQSPYNTTPQYSPTSQSMGSYYPSPMQPTPPQAQISGLYYQRPLPQQFPPPMMPVSVTLTPSSGANMWQHQHHHYISPSSAAAFPQSQDRYICQTCNKAFSRPSSLRIHSHSHTGEKPFRCSHKGCEKAFSVRSNMKRHERGCHEGGTIL